MSSTVEMIFEGQLSAVITGGYHA